MSVLTWGHDLAELLHFSPRFFFSPANTSILFSSQDVLFWFLIIK